MCSFKQHCEESIKLFGKPYEEVHSWLDEFAYTQDRGLRHRQLRHHQSGIDELASIMGDEIREPAKRHIISDISQEGWKEGIHPFPKDQKHYVDMGLY